VIVAIAVGGALPVRGQIMQVDKPKLNADSLRRAFDDKQFYFGLYRDNYFIFGPSLSPKPDKSNTNVKFQISIAQKLTKNTLPWGSYLYLYFSQKVFWNVLQNSMPMTDLNFNPGIGLAKPVFIKDRFVGKISMQIEHESNGRDGDESRSWERISFGGQVLIDPDFVVQGKFWIPIVDGVNNKDLTKYVGLYQVGWSNYCLNRRLSLSTMFTKRSGINFNYNVTLEAAYRLSASQNQYLFAQFYCGYGEGLLAYKEHHTQLRIGIVIKPSLFSEF
jgi:phospholipase A1